MSERDAFGRGHDEDPLAGVGRREPAFVATLAGHQRAPVTAEQPTVPHRLAPGPSPETAELPVLARPAAPVPPRARGRRRGGPRVMSRVLLLSIVAACVLIAPRAGSGVLDGIQDAIRGQGETITRTVPVEGGSLLRAGALQAALAGLPDGDVVLLRVAPDRIDAQVRVGDRLHEVRVTSGGRVFDLPTPAAGRGARVRVDANAPARIVRTAARRAGRSAGDVASLLLVKVGGRTRWQLVFDDGLQYTASASGRQVR